MSEQLKRCSICKSPAEKMWDLQEKLVRCTNRTCHNSLYSVYLNEWQKRPIEDALTARITELEQELNTTDGLLKEATETIGAVVACCTYNSNDDAKIGIYGIDQKAFTRIDQFITHYNDAVSAGKVSVDVKQVKKRDLSDAEIEELGAQEAERKEFCPNCEADVPCTHEAELFVCDICGEDFAKYIVSRNCSVSDVSMTQDVLTDVKTGQSVEIEELETVVEHLQIRLSEWRGVAMLLVDELNEAKSKQLPTSWEDASVASPAYIAYRNLVDVEDDWAGNRPCRRSGDTLLEVRKEDE